MRACTRLITLIAALALCWPSTPATGAPQTMTAKPAFTSEAITAGTNAVSAVYSLKKVEGNFAAQITVTGGGSVSLDYECSIDGTDFINCGNICTNFTATSGPGSDGKDVIEFYPETTMYMRLKSTAVTSNMTVTVKLAIQ